MTSESDKDEGDFVRHAIRVMGNPPNLHPDLAPRGEWRCGKLSLTWGVRTVTEPPTLVHDGSDFSRAAFLPRELPERIAIWKQRLHATTTLDFRDRILLTAILTWNPSTSPTASAKPEST